jgi:hypothetical protein
MFARKVPFWAKIRAEGTVCFLKIPRILFYICDI